MTGELIGFTKEYLKSDLKKTERDTDEYYAFEKMEIPQWIRA
jgi:hypothetical protein